MNDLVPPEVWEDKTYVFLEPTCGNGQFLVRIFNKRINHGLSIEEALNTLIGLDISTDNISDSRSRLVELACTVASEKGIEKGSIPWFNLIERVLAIVHNNIFKVDSLVDMTAYQKGEGILANKKFVFEDPTGNSNVLPLRHRIKKISVIHKALKALEGDKNIPARNHPLCQAIFGIN
jgi:hypothetical protein